MREASVIIFIGPFRWVTLVDKLGLTKAKRRFVMLQKNWRTIFLIVIALAVSTAAFVEYRRINVLNDRLGCAAFWLEKARGLHMVQMKEPSNFTGDTVRDLMDSVDSAYYCATKDPTSGHAPDASRSFGQHGDILQHK